MDDYSWREEKNDYRAPWLKLNKEQMSDPFGWLLSQRSVNVMEILQQMGYDDRQIDLLLHPERATKMKPKFLEMRQRIGQKAVQTYLKQSFYNGLKENKQSMRLNESQLRSVIAESIKKAVNEMQYVTSLEHGTQVPMFHYAGVNDPTDNPFIGHDEGEHYELDEIMEYGNNAYRMIMANVHNLADGDNKDNLLKAAQQIRIALRTLVSGTDLENL